VVTRRIVELAGPDLVAEMLSSVEIEDEAATARGEGYSG
jgi:hypothetical protein